MKARDEFQNRYIPNHRTLREPQGTAPDFGLLASDLTLKK